MLKVVRIRVRIRVRVRIRFCIFISLYTATTCGTFYSPMITEAKAFAPNYSTSW